MSPKADTHTLECGNIYFLYRPRLGHEDPGELEDIQRLYMVLSPDDKERFRITVVGRKKLPDPSESGRNRYWGFVDTVTDSHNTVKEEMGAKVYQTKTRGERRLPESRPAGEGRYRILTHENHTHLVYVLEVPRHPGKPQHEFEIENQASYIISVKNPEKEAPRGIVLPGEQKAGLPESLQQRFEDRRFTNADPPDYLDHPGVEFLLIAASPDLEEELGIKLDTDRETEYSADIFTELHLERKEKVTRALFEKQLA